MQTTLGIQSIKSHQYVIFVLISQIAKNFQKYVFPGGDDYLT